MRLGFSVFVFAVLMSASVWAQGITFEAPGGGVRMGLSGVLDLEGYHVSDPPPGLVFGNGGAFFNPRLTAFGDFRLGQRVYGFAQMRADRGFDPRAVSSDLRLDEYFLRYSLLQNGRLNVQAGKSATLAGNWVARHYSWDNAFVNAPLPYENVTIIWDRWTPSGPASFLGYLQQPDRKSDMLPMIWGPVYAAGLSAFGSAGRWDYGIEVKNVGLSSRPSDWDPREVGWRRPTVSGRAGYRPSPAWNLGVSASRGHYLTGDPGGTLAPGAQLGDFHQTTIGHDLGHAHGHLQVWAEVFWTRFEVPQVGNLRTAAYYFESKYKLTPQLFGAVRWGQQFFSDVAGEPWDRRASRAEIALGYRFSERFQGKVQYGLTFEDRPSAHRKGLAALQMTVRL